MHRICSRSGMSGGIAGEREREKMCACVCVCVCVCVWDRERQDTGKWGERNTVGVVWLIWLLIELFLKCEEGNE